MNREDFKEFTKYCEEHPEVRITVSEENYDRMRDLLHENQTIDDIIGILLDLLEAVEKVRKLRYYG